MDEQFEVPEYMIGAPWSALLAYRVGVLTGTIKLMRARLEELDEQRCDDEEDRFFEAFKASTVAFEAELEYRRGQLQEMIDREGMLEAERELTEFHNL